MADTRTSAQNSIIILGNSGAGKSFLCNLLIGKNVFRSAHISTAVTTSAQSQTLYVENSSCDIWDVPGLIEADEESIKRNKNEIEWAFANSKYACVIFVWTEIGGRLQHDEIIAFNALNDAYQFPVQSLLFVFNNVPSKRPPGYDEKFKDLLWKMLGSYESAIKNMLLIEKIDTEKNESVSSLRRKLWKFIGNGRYCRQEKKREIMLDMDQIDKLKNDLKQLERKFDEERKKIGEDLKRKEIEHLHVLDIKKKEEDDAALKLGKLRETPGLGRSTPTQTKSVTQQLDDLNAEYLKSMQSLNDRYLFESQELFKAHIKKCELVIKSNKHAVDHSISPASTQEFDQSINSDQLRICNETPPVRNSNQGRSQYR